VLRFYFDEDVMVSAVAAELRAAGIDVVTVRDAGRRGSDDPPQLHFATEQQRVVMTANIADFARLHAAWMRQGQTHAGIIFVPQQHFGVGETIRRLLRLATSLDPADMIDRVEYLTSWD